MKVSIGDSMELYQQTLRAQRLENLRFDNSEADKHATRTLIVNATPKSGSTWAANVLRRAFKATRFRYSYAWSSNEHDLYPPALLVAKRHRTVGQLHMKATPHNINLMLNFNTKMLLLTRNVFDAVVSFARDIQKKSQSEGHEPGWIGYSFSWQPYCDPDWSFDQFLDHAIRYYMPWYMNFLMSWDLYHEQVGAIRLRYEELIQDPRGHFLGIADQLGWPIELTDEVMDRDYQVGHVSGTKSEPGSGLDHLSKKQIEDIRGFFSDRMGDWVNGHLTHEV